MSRQDYVAIAKIIADELKIHDRPARVGIDIDTGAVEALFVVAGGIALHFEQHYPAFDRERFLTACGVDTR